MFGFLGKVKDAVAQNVSSVTNKIKNEVNDFLEENKKLEDKAKAEEQSSNPHPISIIDFSVRTTRR